MPPIWMDKTVEQMSQAELRITMLDPWASEICRNAAGARLAKLQEASSTSSRRYDARVRKAKQVYRQTQRHSPRGSLDPRNLTYAAKRAKWTIGGVWGAISAGMASYQFWAGALGLPPAQVLLRLYPVLTIAGGVFVLSAVIIYGVFLLDEKQQSFKRKKVKRR